LRGKNARAPRGQTDGERDGEKERVLEE